MYAHKHPNSHIHTCGRRYSESCTRQHAVARIAEEFDLRLHHDWGVSFACVEPVANGHQQLQFFVVHNLKLGGAPAFESGTHGSELGLCVQSHRLPQLVIARLQLGALSMQPEAHSLANHFLQRRAFLDREIGLLSQVRHLVLRPCRLGLACVQAVELVVVGHPS